MSPLAAAWSLFIGTIAVVFGLLSLLPFPLIISTGLEPPEQHRYTSFIHMIKAIRHLKVNPINAGVFWWSYYAYTLIYIGLGIILFTQLRESSFLYVVGATVIAIHVISLGILVGLAIAALIALAVVLKIKNMREAHWNRLDTEANDSTTGLTQSQHYDQESLAESVDQSKSFPLRSHSGPGSAT